MFESLLKEKSGDMAEATTFVGLGERMSHRMAPTCDWTDMGFDAHFVQFFESDSFIVNEVSEYLLHGLRTGETCIAVATKEHLRGIESQMKKYAADLKGQMRDWHYIPCDAHETLAKILTDGVPDKQKFAKVIGKLVGKAAKNDRGVRIFGEMVGILCSQEKYDAAVQLEGLWNDLKKIHKFSLFCGYSMSSLNTSGALAMSEICAGHTNVIPTESYSSLNGTKERLKHIAQLQQRTKELEAEILELERRIEGRQTTGMELVSSVV